MRIVSDNRGMTNGEVKEKLQRDAFHRIAKENGLTNGMGRTNGMTNGLAEQHGFINGNSKEAYEKGYTNGVAKGYDGGFTNGLAKSDKLEIRQLRTPIKRTKKRQVLITIGIIMAIICVPFLTSFMVNEAPIIIDGVFKDWADVSVYHDAVGDVANSNVDIDTYKIKLYNNKVFVYMSSVDDMLTGNSGGVHDTIIFMADTDSKYETGYQSNGLGYDYMVQVSGCDNVLVRTKGFSYQGVGNDWNEWRTARSVANVVGNEVEIEFHSSSPEYAVIDAYYVSADGEVDQIDCLMSNNYQAFRIEQENTLPDLCRAEEVDVLNVQMSCDVNSTVVNSIRFNKIGTARDSSFGRFSLEDDMGCEVGYGFITNGIVQIDTNIVMAEGESVNYILSANMQEQISGDTFMFEIESPYDVVSSIVPKVYAPEKRLSYIGYIPTTVNIDGGFGEWDMKNILINPNLDNPNIDIISSDYHYEDNGFSMAVGYSGKAMGGDLMPFNAGKGRKVSPVETDSVEVETNINYTYVKPDPITGEDILQVRFGEDARVEVRGIAGRITKSVWSVREGENWTEVGSIDAYCDEHGVELTVGGVDVDVEDVTIVTSDWMGSVDISNLGQDCSEILFGTRSESGYPETPFQTLGNNTHIIARMTHYPVTIDGVITTTSHNEWYPSEYYLVNLARDLDVGVQMNDDFNSVYFYVVSYDEVSNNIGDYAEIYIDTDDDETSNPDVDDVKFRVYQNDTVAYFEGDGADWVQKSVPANCSGANFYQSGVTRHNYEFNISWDVINKNNLFDTHMDTVGFGSHVYLAGETDHVWYPSQYSSTNPPATQYDAIPNEWSNLVYNNWTKNMTQYSSISPPTIDGVLDETEWGTHASYHTFTDTQTMSFYFMANETHFWYGGMLDNDNVLEAGDFCQLFFSISHTGQETLYPDTDDIGWSLTGANSTSYYVGTGSGWTSTTIPTGWEGKASYTDGIVTFEMQGLMSNLSAGTGFDESGDVILFLNMITDSGDYTMQYPDYYGGVHDMRYDPECWVHLVLVIPEFRDFVIPIIFFGLIGSMVVRKRRFA